MRSELITHKNPKSPNSEIFRTLRTNIQFMNTNKKMKTLLITSTFPGEGKSWVASNLAVTFAQAGKKVILIDADMRKGRLYRIFEISPKPGLSNFLSEVEFDETGKSSIDVTSYIQETGVNNLYVFAAGNVPPNPSELLVSSQMAKLLNELKSLCDLIIIDGTPCELVTDSIILSRIVDCTVLVSAYKITKKDALERVVKNLQNVGANLAGVVFNKIPVSVKKYGQQYYYYGNRKTKKEQKSTLDLLKERFNSIKSKTKPQEDENIENKIADLYKNMDEENLENDDIQTDLTLNSDIKTDFTVNNEVKTDAETTNEQEVKEKSDDIKNQINTFFDGENNNG